MLSPIKHPLLAALVVVALYLPMAYVATATYEPDPSKPPDAAGIRVRLNVRDMATSGYRTTIRDVRGIFEMHGDVDDADTHSPIEVWENGKKLGPAHSTVNEIAQFGRGRFRLEPGRGIGGWLTFSSSDNTNPMTNGRTYWAVHPPR